MRSSWTSELLDFSSITYGLVSGCFVRISVFHKEHLLLIVHDVLHCQDMSASSENNGTILYCLLRTPKG